MPHILLVEEDHQDNKTLLTSFQRSGFAVSAIRQENNTLRQIECFNPDILVLDVQSSAMHGREIVRQLRHQNNWVPILMIGAGDAAECAVSLDEGADDYITRPINHQEFISRMRAVLRRMELPCTPQKHYVLQSGDLVLDSEARKVWLRGEQLKMTPKSFLLLEHLMRTSGKTQSREELLRAVWEWENVQETRAVDARVAELRQILYDDSKDPCYIETVLGQGYRFTAEVLELPCKYRVELR